MRLSGLWSVRRHNLFALLVFDGAKLNDIILILAVASHTVLIQGSIMSRQRRYRILVEFLLCVGDPSVGIRSRCSFRADLVGAEIRDQGVRDADAAIGLLALL